MTGIQLVVALVREHGAACIDDILAKCDLTRPQIRKALSNAQARGYLRGVGPSGQKRERGRGTVLYEVTDLAPPPVEKVDVPPSGPRGNLGHLGKVASVWELGAQ